MSNKMKFPRKMILCLGEILSHYIKKEKFHTPASYQGGVQIILASLLKRFHIVIFELAVYEAKFMIVKASQLLFPLYFFFLGNCAHYQKGGWWYNSCAHSNLNGVWYRGGHYRSRYQDGVYWAEFRGGAYSLKKVVMMIRPNPNTFH